MLWKDLQHLAGIMERIVDKIVIALCMLALRQDYTTVWNTTLGIAAWAAFALTMVRLFALLAARRRRGEKLS